MAPKAPRPATPPPPRQLSRIAVLGLGFVLGAAVGTVLCVVLFLVGYIGTEPFDWFYRIVTTALIGMIVGMVFGPLRPAQAPTQPTVDRKRFRRRF